MQTRQALKTKKNLEQVPQSSRNTTLAEVGIKEELQPKWTIDRLRSSYTPSQIPGRDEEKQYIHTFIQDCILNRINSKILYISGIPGVGKTASTLEIINKLKKEYSRKAMFGQANALQLQRPDDVFKNIYRDLTGEVPHKMKNICNQIQQLLAGVKKSYILLIDEIDYLLNKDEKILYNLFDWVSDKTSKIGLVIIANTMDFPERLTERVNSRMGTHRLIFAPYTCQQIKQIVEQRLEGCEQFTESALMFISKKLAGHNSDIRTILKVLEAAVQNHLQAEQKEKIGIQTMNRLWEEMVVPKRDQKFSKIDGLIFDILKKYDNETDSFTLLDVVSQRGVTSHNFTLMLKELEEQGYIQLKPMRKGMFYGYKVKLFSKYVDQ